MIIGYAIPAVQKFQGAAYKSLYYQALEISKADGATPDNNPCLIARGDELYRAGVGAVPSVLIVPQFVKPGAVYTQIPTPTLEGGDFDQFTVTRATAATRVNASGLIESVASGLLRLDYPIGGGCPAALIEPSAQNLAFHSSDWTSNWNGGSASGTTVVTNSAISLAPDGTATANEIYPTSGNTNHIRTSNSTTAVTYVSGTVYTQSAFFKAGIGVGIQVQLTNTTARFDQSGYANFDLIAGTVLVVSGTTADTNRAARIENYGNGWYRCSYTATCTSNGTGIGVVAGLISASGDTRFPSFLGTVTDYLLGWGAQVETGAIPTSYIPTTTGSATRNAEVCSVSGVSGYIGQTEGTIYAEVDLRTFPEAGSPVIGIVTLNVGANNLQNSIILGVERQSGGTNRFYCLVLVSNATQAELFGSTLTNGIYKLALTYKQNDFALYVNGTSIATDNSGNVPACSEVFIGNRFNTDTRFLNDRIRAAAIYTTRLSNDQLASLTRLT